MTIAAAYQSALANSIAINGTVKNEVTGVDGSVTGQITSGVGYLEAASQPSDYVLYPALQKIASNGVTFVIQFSTTATTTQSIFGTADTGLNYLEAANLNVTGAAGTAQVGSLSIIVRGTGGNASAYTIAGKTLNNGAVRTVVVAIDGATQVATAWVDGASATITRDGSAFSTTATNTEFGYALFGRNLRGTVDQFFSGRIYKFARLLGTGFDGASLSSNPDQIFEAAVTPITLTGTIQNQTFTNGQAVSVDLSTYFSGTQIPFTFANTGAALTGTGLTISSAGLLSGTATTGSVTGVVVTGTDADLATASSNAFNVTVNAAGLPPAGTFTVGTITTTQTTASVPYTYFASDFDTIEYRIDGGTPVTASASPQSLTGLTAGTTYGIEFRAVNAFGNGAWSTSAPFTTAAVPVGTITLIDLADNTTTLWSNLSGIDCIVMNESATSIVVAKTGLTASAGGDVTFNDAAITAGTWYTVVIVNGTNRGVIRIQAT